MPVPGQDPSQYTLLDYHTDWFQSHTQPDTVRSTAYHSTRSVGVVMRGVYHPGYESDVEYCSTRSVGVVMSGVNRARYESDVESFQRHVLECVTSSRELLYKDPDPDDAHAIRFCRYYGRPM